MIDRRVVSNFNWFFFLAILTVSVIGVVTIYSANHARPEEFFRVLYIKQIYWILYGLIAMLFALVLDYRWFSRYAFLIYTLTFFGLVYVLVNGVVASGSKRWIYIGPISIQVSEFAKIAIIIVLAKYFESEKISGQYALRDLVVPAILTAALGGLIVVQPDLGTTMMILFIFLAFIVAIEINRMTLIKLFMSGLAFAPALWFFLKDYQKARVRTLFNPDLDPLGAGYHSIQSKIAIGSGGFWGKGLFAGTQSRLNFLPEKHTDFIFTLFSEEFGFIGSIGLMILYSIIILRVIRIGTISRSSFARLFCFGFAFAIFIYITVNLSMVLGLLPIVGSPLPIMSYGGSSMLATMIGFGIVMSAKVHSKQMIA